MATVKTAISLEQVLYDTAEKLAKTLRLSRSQLMSKALKEFIEHEQNCILLDRLNRAYAKPEPTQDTKLRTLSKKYWQRRRRDAW